jgi:hypothetical protein
METTLGTRAILWGTSNDIIAMLEAKERLEAATPENPVKCDSQHY